MPDRHHDPVVGDHRIAPAEHHDVAPARPAAHLAEVEQGLQRLSANAALLHARAGVGSERYRSRTHKITSRSAGETATRKSSGIMRPSMRMGVAQGMSHYSSNCGYPHCAFPSRETKTASVHIMRV